MLKKNHTTKISSLGLSDDDLELMREFLGVEGEAEGTDKSVREAKPTPSDLDSFRTAGEPRNIDNTQSPGNPPQGRRRRKDTAGTPTGESSVTPANSKNSSAGNQSEQSNSQNTSSDSPGTSQKCLDISAQGNSVHYDSYTKPRSRKRPGTPTGTELANSGNYFGMDIGKIGDYSEIEKASETSKYNNASKPNPSNYTGTKKKQPENIWDTNTNRISTYESAEDSGSAPSISENNAERFGNGGELSDNPTNSKNAHFNDWCDEEYKDDLGHPYVKKQTNNSSQVDIPYGRDGYRYSGGSHKSKKQEVIPIHWAKHPITIRHCKICGQAFDAYMGSYVFICKDCERKMGGKPELNKQRP